MTNTPLAPKKLGEWTHCTSGNFWYVVVDLGGIPHTYRIDHKADYGWLVSWNCDSLTERIGVFLNEEAAQAAAQAHYNSLVTDCCEVKRCVCSFFSLIPNDREVYMAAGCTYCPNCGGLIETEGA